MAAFHSEQRLTASKVQSRALEYIIVLVADSEQRLTASKVQSQGHHHHSKKLVLCEQRLTASKVQSQRLLKALYSNRLNPILQAPPAKTQALIP